MATVILVCDVCGTKRQGKPGGSAAELREQLRAVGWATGGASNHDYCPRCLHRPGPS